MKLTNLCVGAAFVAVGGVFSHPILDAETPAQEVGSARVVPIQVTGDPAARFSMVVMGDGYTATDMPKYRAHVDKHLNVLWSIEPFRSYRNYINVYSVEIVSGESGITCDPEIRERRTTPLGLEFGNAGGGGGGCTNINARGITPQRGKEALIREYAAKGTPNYDQILIIANTDTYGGIGGSLATTSGGNSLGPLITPHELGHSLGRLTDEYTYSARGVKGPAYSGNEPTSPHMTVMSIEDMLTKQAKWFRWLGEPSESGGKIERFEGGSQRSSGVFRPSKHSMMISVGYYFDQVSREQMVRRISEQVKLIADSTPEDAVLSPKTDIVWIDTPQPTYHELTITWLVDGKPVRPAGGAGANANAQQNFRYFDLEENRVSAGATVTVMVVDPTPFVRDPEIRGKVLTATRSWKVTNDTGGIQGDQGTFTGSTPTVRPLGRGDVVSVSTSNPRDRMVTVAWTLDGKPVRVTGDARVLPLAPQQLTTGTHTLAATTVDPSAAGVVTGTRTWTIDSTEPTVAATISGPVATIAGAEPHYFVRDEFTMKLDPSDDQPGYVVAEFRVNGDGWHHYYGWPDAPPGTPFKFTPRGTTIKELVYGSLASEGLSPQPWEPREPGWGTHRIEYRGIDAAGNIGAAKAFKVTFESTPACTATITGKQQGDLTVKDGVTCLAPGATVVGQVTVAPGASLIATKATVTGGITTSGANTIELVDVSVTGSVRLSGSIARITVFGSTIGGDLSVAANKTPKPPTLVGNSVKGQK
jgi:hypothetical protein